MNETEVAEKLNQQEEELSHKTAPDDEQIESPPKTKKRKCEEGAQDVTNIAEFIPNKHYRCSVWRTEAGNVFIKRSEKGVGGAGLKKIFSEESFSYEASKTKIRLTITMEKPKNFARFFEDVTKAFNKAIMSFHKNKVLELIK